MELEKKLAGSSLYVKPKGRIDINTAVDFGTSITDDLDDIKELILDFAEVVYISSMGLRVLLEIQKQMNTQGSMVIINANNDLKSIFEMTGFTNIVRIE